MLNDRKEVRVAKVGAVVRHLEVDHFKALTHVSLDFKLFTLIVGRNNVGKTSLLDAIYLGVTGHIPLTPSIEPYIFLKDPSALINRRSATKKARIRCTVTKQNSVEDERIIELSIATRSDYLAQLKQDLAAILTALKERLNSRIHRGGLRSPKMRHGKSQT